MNIARWSPLSIVLLVVATLVAMTVIGIVIILVLEVAAGIGIISPTSTVLVYDQMRIGQGAYWFESVTIGGSERGDRIPDLYVKFEDGAVVFLPDLTIREFDKHIPYDRVLYPGQQRYAQENWRHIGGGGKFHFKNGRLVDCGINHKSRCIVGRSANGPFLSLPASSAQVYKVFGRPKQVKRVEDRRTAP